MSFENFTTLITQIEAILNSRPLIAPSSDANDPSALTPAHFLIGRPLTALPEPSQEDNRTLSRRFKSINNIVRQFWKKWSVDYLTTLQHRPKWHDNKQQHAVNDIVIIKEDNTPAMLWPLARITKIFDGNDKIVRVVQVKTQTGLYKTSKPICTIGEGKTRVSVTQMEDSGWLNGWGLTSQQHSPFQYVKTGR